MNALNESERFKLLKEMAARPSDLMDLLPWALIGTALILIGVFLRRGKLSYVGTLFSGLALFGAMIFTYTSVDDLPENLREPITATHRMIYAAFAVALVGVICEIFREIPTICRPLQVAAAALLVMWPLKPFLDPEHAYHVSSFTVAIFVGAIVVLWSTVDDLARRHKGPTVPLVLCLSLGALGQMCAIAGSAMMAQLAGASSMALGAAAVVTWWLPNRTIPSAVSGAFAGVAGGCMIVTWVNSDPVPPLSPFGIVAGAPLLLWLLKLPKVRNLKAALGAIIAILLVLGAIGWGIYDLLGAVLETNDVSIDPEDGMLNYMEEFK